MMYLSPKFKTMTVQLTVIVFCLSFSKIIIYRYFPQFVLVDVSHVALQIGSIVVNLIIQIPDVEIKYNS